MTEELITQQFFLHTRIEKNKIQFSTSPMSSCYIMASWLIYLIILLYKHFSFVLTLFSVNFHCGVLEISTLSQKVLRLLQWKLQTPKKHTSMMIYGLLYIWFIFQLSYYASPVILTLPSKLYGVKIYCRINAYFAFANFGR